MRAAVLHAVHEPLRLEERPLPAPGPGEVLIRVGACGVCRTDLHVVDGELTDARLPLVPGHEVVGTVVGGAGHPLGARVGVPWLGFACGTCAFCTAGQENLCPEARFTGYQRDGGYAEYLVADARFCFPLPAGLSDLEAAPLLCAGLIGFRALQLAGAGKRLGLYGFGVAAHLLAQVALAEGREVFAFTRPGDDAAQRFALSLGVTWAGASDAPPPLPLDAALLFAPVGGLVPLALAAVRPGGTVVCGGIHMSDIPSFPYALLWGERVLRSVANLTRRDAVDFFEVVGRMPLQVVTQPFPLQRANEALTALRDGTLTGAAVLVP